VHFRPLVKKKRWRRPEPVRTKRSLRPELLAVLISACGTTAPAVELDAISWSMEPTCERPNEADLAAVAEGVALWIEGFGVVIVADESAAAVQVLICLTDEPIEYSSSVIGLTSDTGPGSYRIQIDRRSQRFSGRYYGGLIAHELGHVVLPGNGVEDHLPDEESGIMSWTRDCVGETHGCQWSDADVEMIEQVLRGE